MVANPASELNLETVRTPEEITVRCTGRINSSTSAQLHTTVRSLMSETKSVVLDLTNVSHMDSAGLGVMFGLYVSAKKQHCALKFINPSQHLQDLFRITKLESVFEVHHDFLRYRPDRA
jgi:anti-sigma B factor antagonist